MPSRSEIQQSIENGEIAAKKLADPEYEQLEASLLAGRDFQQDLHRYVERHK